MLSEQTKQLVLSFMDTKNNNDFRLLPSIIVGMQEDDNVADTLTYRNCFRKLRNMCAHEPVTLTSQLLTGENIGNSRLVFRLASEIEGRLVLDIPSFTVWMFEMFFKSGNAEYLAFWETLMCKLYPCVATKQYEGKPFTFHTKEWGGLQETIYALQDFEYKEFNKLKSFNKDDPYFAKLYNSNRKLYWRMVIPNLMDMVELFLTKTILWTDKENLKSYIQLFNEREGS